MRVKFYFVNFVQSLVELSPYIKKSFDISTRKLRLYTSASRAVIMHAKRNLRIPDFLVNCIKKDAF